MRWISCVRNCKWPLFWHLHTCPRSSLPMRKGSAQASDCTPDFISPTKPVFCETIWARRKDRYQNQSTPQDWTSFIGILGKQILVNRPLKSLQKLVWNVISGKRSSTFSSPPVGFLLTDPSTSFKVGQSFQLEVGIESIHSISRLENGK